MAPPGVGERSGSLLVVTDAPGDLPQIPTRGVGTEPTALTLDATSVAFGAVPVDQLSNVRRITLTNSGEKKLAIFGLSSDGLNVADFAKYDDTCSSRLIDPGAACTLDFGFTPIAAGARSMTLEITSNATGSPHRVMLSGTGARPAPATNLLRNAGFELDANTDTRPDSWSINDRVTRSTLVKRNGTFAMRHASASDGSYTITSARMYGLRAGTPYAFSGWINIPAPAIADTTGYSFTLEVRWRDAANSTIATVPVQTFAAHTGGTWRRMSRQLLAPSLTTSAVVRIVADSLTHPVYVDDVFFGNLLANPGFELDANHDTQPDRWTTNPNVTRSNAHAHGGGYAMRHQATTGADYTLVQVVPNITPGSYRLRGFVKIPASTGTLSSFTLEVRWRNGSTSVGSPVVVGRFTGTTAGWAALSAQLTAPAGTNNAQVRMVVRDLNRTIYVDNLLLHP